MHHVLYIYIWILIHDETHYRFMYPCVKHVWSVYSCAMRAFSWASDHANPHGPIQTSSICNMEALGLWLSWLNICGFNHGEPYWDYLQRWRNMRENKYGLKRGGTNWETSINRWNIVGASAPFLYPTLGVTWPHDPTRRMPGPSHKSKKLAWRYGRGEAWLLNLLSHAKLMICYI